MNTVGSSLSMKVVEFPQGLQWDDPLATRESAKQERSLLERELEGLEQGEVVGVDVRRVLFINYTFSDECFGKLMGKLRAGEFLSRFMVLIASREDLEDKLRDVSIALASRKLAMLNIAAPDDASDPGIVGSLPEYLEDTLRAVRPGDTNEILADRLGINLTTCSNRTDKLTKMRLLRRKLHQGNLGYKQYEFAPVFSPVR